MDVPVGPGRLGRDLYALGNPLDSMGPVEAVKRHRAPVSFLFFAVSVQHAESCSVPSPSSSLTASLQGQGQIHVRHPGGPHPSQMSWQLAVPLALMWNGQTAHRSLTHQTPRQLEQDP